MEEAKRRRAARISISPTMRQIEQTFRTIRTEGGGVYTLTLLSPVAALRLFSPARSGNRIAQVQLEAVGQIIELVQHEAPAAPLCLLCGAGFRLNRLPMVFGFLQAHRDDPTQIVANAICAECCTKHPTSEAMERAVTDYLRANLIPDLRVLPQPMSEAGHA